MAAIKQIIAVLLVLVISTQAKTEAQNIMFPSGAKWYYNEQQWVDIKNFGYTIFEVKGDTIIENNKALTIIEKRFPHSGNMETLKTHVFKVDSTKVDRFEDGEFQPMFNFSLDVGDTLFHSKYNFEACDSFSPYIVDSSYIQYHNGIPLIHQLVSSINYYKPEWGYPPTKVSYELIEKIGYVQNFIFKPSCKIEDSFGVNQSLRCYTDSDFHYQSDWWEHSSCDAIITGNDKLKFNEHVFVYPTISNKLLMFNSSKEKNFEARIYDQNGTLKIHLKGKVPFNADISMLKPGIHLVVFNIGNNYTTHKIIRK
jgi:hypothetical protein